jgi:CRISPR-associated protein Csh1
MGDKVLLEVLETLEEQAYRSLGDRRFIANFTADERELVETVLKECGDSVSFNFLFIKAVDAAEKIKCFISDVLPSRISILYDAAQYVHDTMVTVLRPQDPNDRRTGFAFGTMARFFFSGDSHTKGKRSDKEFLDLVDRVFKGRKIDRVYFFERLSQGISEAFKDAIQDNSKKSDFYFATLDGLRTTLFVSYLNLIGGKYAEVNRVGERKYEWFFEQFQGSFSEPYAKGLFLLGAASQLIIQAQDAMGRSGSIASSLKDLRMKEEDFKELVPKLRAKIDQLGASLGSPSASDVGGNVGALLFMAKDYLTEASYYILQAADYWNASTGELNFYFACGMNLAWEPRHKKGEMQTAEEEE